MNSIKKFFTSILELFAQILGGILLILLIYVVYRAFSTSYPSIEELTFFEGRIKTISHETRYRSRRDESRIFLENYHLVDFILYHVPDRKEAILNLKQGQHISIWARDDDVLIDRDDTKTFEEKICISSWI